MKVPNLPRLLYTVIMMAKGGTVPRICTTQWQQEHSQPSIRLSSLPMGSKLLCMCIYAFYMSAYVVMRMYTYI